MLENLTMDGTFERMVVLADRSLYRSDVARPVFECLDMWLGGLETQFLCCLHACKILAH